MTSSLSENRSLLKSLADRSCERHQPIICERRNRTNGIWLALLGPDRVGKKRAALALSEILFRDQANCISVDFGGEHCYVDDRFRGKTVRLSEGVSTGKLRDSHGRVISMKNVIVLATSSAIVKEKVEPCEVLRRKEFSALEAGGYRLRLADAARAGVNKRKHEGEETELRAEKVQRSYLDLNLPVDETETEEAKAWFERFHRATRREGDVQTG
ncbi:Double Clp-N motif-containing P-loop nucleoside triphosphate hydrolases superfamily protein [Raphanus sativus]|nr:Double Clp-N motif-containing P-loop nucleoside triphosphate hydrolases superfamily protein [Raphanus sativus]